MGYGKKSFKELMDGKEVTLVDIIVDMERGMQGERQSH